MLLQQSVNFLSFVPQLEINIEAPYKTRFGQNPSPAKTKQNKSIYYFTLQQKGRSAEMEIMKAVMFANGSDFKQLIQNI